MNPRTFVPPTGLPDSKIMLVGEQPGKREVQLRKPFCGPAGKELKEDLHHAGIPTTDCYFTNVVKDLDKPLAHYIDLSKGKPRVTAEGQEYINRLRDEIQVEGKGSNVIVAVGAIALFAITGRMGITKWRGSIIESTLVPSKKVIPVIHPATVMPPKNVYTNKYLIVMDLVRAKEQAEFPEINLTPRNCVIDPSFEQAMGFLDHCYKEGINGAVIDADIEVVRHTLSCISFAYDEYNAISIPFYGPKGDYFTINQEAEIMKKIEQILSHPLIVKAGQNFIFDIDFLMTNYGIIPRGPLYDTMIAQRISMPDLPAGLDFIASIHTDIPYYKEEGKRWMKVGGSFKQFWNYNAMDAISTAAARESQLTIIHQQKNTSTLSRKMNSHYPYLYMMQRGTLVDIEGMKKKRDETEDNIDKLREKLAEKAGYAFNPNSPQQVMHYFHNVKGLKPYMKRGKDGWTPTSDEDAMKRHARNGIDEARIILDIRGEQKRLGTYLDVSKVDPDGRIRGQYSPHKTVTGRPSSSQNIITKTGTNMQNWPHDLLSFLIPDPGYWYVSIDLSQIENRIVAYVGRVLPMIEAFENEIDVHRLTAAMIFSKPFDEVSDEPGSTTLGDGRHSERDWGKQANHSLNYDFGYKNFALKYEIPEAQAKWMVEKYHRSYPEVREGFHALVKTMLQTDRYLTNLYGRRRKFLDKWDNQLFKDAYAHIPQSTTADKIDEEGLNYIYYNQDMFKPIELLNIVHDSVGFQIPVSVSWERQAKMIKAIKDSLETPLVWRDREFTVPADVTFGLTLNKEDGLELKAKNFPSDTNQLATKLRDIYQQLTDNRSKEVS